jgi:hypothetical protein
VKWVDCLGEEYFVKAVGRVRTKEGEKILPQLTESEPI